MLKQIANITRSVFGVPRYISPDRLSVYFSDDKLRFLTYEHTNFGFIPKYFDLISNTNLLQNGFIQDAVAVSVLLKQIKKQNKAKVADLVLPEVLSYMILQKLDSKTSITKEYVEFLIGANTQLNIDNVTYSYDYNPRYLSVSVQEKNVINTYVKTAELAGLHVENVFSFASSVSKVFAKPGVLDFILYTDDDNAVIIVSDEGVPVFSNTIAVNLDDALEKLGSALKTKSKNPQQTKIAMDVALNATSPIWSELQRLIVFWSARQDSMGNLLYPRKRLIVSGINSELMKLVLQSKFSLQAPAPNPWQHLFNINQIVPDITYEQALQYVPCIGTNVPQMISFKKSYEN